MLTTHAVIRCRQRGIPDEVVDVLLDYGCERRRHGATVHFMDRKARRRARADLGDDGFARLADRLGSYLVVADDGAVITAAPRRRRLKFDGRRRARS